MKRISFVLIISILCFILTTAIAVAENEVTQDIDLMLHGALLRDSGEESNDPFYLTPAQRDESTAELGDNSVAPGILIGGIGLASVGLIAAQKKLKRVS